MHASTGKRCVAHDEFVEHANRFFSEFAPPKSLKSFVEQSLYVGLGLVCRAFTDTWYTTAFKEKKQGNYTRSVAPCMTPEKKLLYEALKLLQTHRVDKTRTVSDIFL